MPTPEPFRFLRFGAGLAGGVSSSIERLARFVARTGISPDTLTILGLAGGAAAGVFFGLGRPFPAFLALAFCGLSDVLDGKVAAVLNARSAFGAILDSSFDRYSEFFIYAGMAYHFRGSWAWWLGFFAFLGSTMVSYTRARAEGLGFACPIGLMQRAERMVLIGLASILSSIVRVFDPAVITVLILISILSNVTAIQRLFWVRRKERERTDGRNPPTGS